MCPSIPDPLNGDISYSTDPSDDGSYSFGTVATYTCDEGYGQRGGVLRRTCGGDGSSNRGAFSGEPGLCEGMLYLSQSILFHYMSRHRRIKFLVL